MYRLDCSSNKRVCFPAPQQAQKEATPIQHDLKGSGALLAGRRQRRLEPGLLFHHSDLTFLPQLELINFAPHPTTLLRAHRLN